MKITYIIILVIGLCVVLIIIKNLLKSKPLTNVSVSSKQIIIPASSIPTLEYGNTNNSTYSIWFYVSNWEITHSKIIFQTIVNQDSNLVVYLGQYSNDLTVSLPELNYNNQMVNVKNIPIQKWVNVILVIAKNNLIIYINGELNQSCLLNNNINSLQEDVIITPTNKTFVGWSSKFQYWPQVKNNNELIQIYNNGA